MTVPNGILQGFTQAAGEALNTFGGLRSTRLSRASSKGDTTVHVERTAGLPDSGKVAIDGIPYTYGSVSDGVLGKIAFKHGGNPVQGTAAAHKRGAQVIDLSGQFSGLDLVKRALFVDTAEGEFLSALGRNLGVLRIPALSDDDQFRELIKVLAYNPRGTLYGLALVLDALIGRDNYAITEDLIRRPCEVTVTLPGALFLDAIAAGKAFLSAPTTVEANGGTLAAPTVSTYISSVRQGTEAWRIQCQTTPPDSFDDRPYDGAPLQKLLPYVGDRMGIGFDGNVYDYGSNSSAPYTVLDNVTGYFERLTTFSADPVVSLQMTLNFDGDRSKDSEDARRFNIVFGDGTKSVAIGVMSDSEGNRYKLSFMSPQATSITRNDAVSIINMQTYTVCLRKNGAESFDFLLNGDVMQTLPYSEAFDTTFSGVRIGNTSGIAGGVYVATDSVELSTDGASNNELLNLRRSDGALSSDDGTLYLDTPLFAPSDTGHLVRIRGARAKNAQGGSNNGDYTAQYKNDYTLLLNLPGGNDAQLSAVYPQRIVFQDAPQLLYYPSSLGTRIRLQGSAQGNDGQYTIVRLLDPDTLQDLAEYPCARGQYTNVCEVDAASFVAEQRAAYQLYPAFTDDSVVTFELVDAATHGRNADGTAFVTPRGLQNITDGSYLATFNQVLSSQVFDTSDPFVSLLKKGTPNIYSAAPFYVSDPLVFIEAYLSGVVAAGVRLNLQFT